MEIMTLESFQKYLDSEKRPERFKIEALDQNTVNSMLLLSYKNEVSKRRMAFVADPVVLKNIQKTAKWLTGDYKFSLMVYGSVGNGKTTLLKSVSSLLNALDSDKHWGEQKRKEFISAIDIYNIAKSDNEKKYDSIKECDLLFIDDLGVEPVTAKVWGNEISPITDILYYRYDNQLFTVVSSNLSDSALKERYGERIASRMDEMFECIHFSGDSYRK